MSKTTLFAASWRVTKAGFITLIRKQNDRARKRIIQHRQRKRSRKHHPQPVKPWELYAGVLKDAHWSSFCQQRKRRCCSLPLDTPQVPSCTARQTSRDEKDILKTTTHGPHWIHSIQKNLETSPHPPYSQDLALSDYNLFGFVKDHIWIQQRMTNGADLEAIRSFLRTAATGPAARGSSDF